VTAAERQYTENKKNNKIAENKTANAGYMWGYTHKVSWSGYLL